MYIGGGDASERDYLSESRRLVSTHCIRGVGILLIDSIYA